ncbi:MAG: hypothetical protein FJX74_23710, partial [Armatimonadetes bacterium]|nr:hypothetical protein [Armatimonadota bacterium]
MSEVRAARTRTTPSRARSPLQLWIPAAPARPEGVGRFARDQNEANKRDRARREREHQDRLRELRKTEAAARNRKSGLNVKAIYAERNKTARQADAERRDGSGRGNVVTPKQTVGDIAR